MVGISYHLLSKTDEMVVDSPVRSRDAKRSETKAKSGFALESFPDAKRIICTHTHFDTPIGGASR